MDEKEKKTKDENEKTEEIQVQVGIHLLICIFTSSPFLNMVFFVITDEKTRSLSADC